MAKNAKWPMQCGYLKWLGWSTYEREATPYKRTPVHQAVNIYDQAGLGKIRSVNTTTRVLYYCFAIPRAGALSRAQTQKK